MRIVASILFVALCIAGASAADPQKLAMIDELLALTKQREKMEQLRLDGVAQVRGYLERQSHPSDDLFTRGMRERLLAKYEMLTNEVMGWERWRGEYRSVYDEALSSDELSALISFYKSDAGKGLLKIIDELGTKMATRVSAESARIESRIDLLIVEAEAEVRREMDGEKGEPGATDNPDDAQRLREDH